MARQKFGLGRRGVQLLTSIATLAAWRWKQQWFLLLVTGLGVIAAVTMVCALPLFSSVMGTSGLRSTLRGGPGSSGIAVTTEISQLSPDKLDEISRDVNSPIQRHLGTYLQGAPRIDIVTFPYPVTEALSFNLSLYGTPILASKPHLNLLQGRLPGDHSQRLEVALTPEVMVGLHVHIGSQITVQAIVYNESPAFETSAFQALVLSIPLQVVGSIHVKAGDPYWHGDNFEPSEPGTGQDGTNAEALVSSQALLQLFYHTAQTNDTRQIYFPQSFSATWYYALALQNITANQLNDLISQLAAAHRDIDTTFNDAKQDIHQFVSHAALYGDVVSTSNNPSILEKFRGQLAAAQVPTILLALQITCLLLLFVSVMAALLVDRQAEVIAVLRSRGASRRQILGSLVTQGLGVSLIALAVGPPLALVLVLVVTSQALPPDLQDALNAIMRAPWLALQSVVWYALAAAGATLLTMIFSLYRATQLDVISVRRETTRSSKRPLWQRLRLDLWGLIVALTGYVLSLYLGSTSQFLNVQSQVLVVAPLTLIAPFFLLLAAILFFLRFFPVLLRVTASLALRGRSATSMLALAHMARSPRQPMRLALLLGLATAFTIFSLVLSASQTQRAQDIATYQAGSDFNGSLPVSADVLPLAQETDLYKKINGVTSATVGYINIGGVMQIPGAPPFPMQIRAVDTTTFAQTALWSDQDSSQTLPELLAQLQAWKQRGLQRGLVPALVDASAWNTLHLHTGSIFSVIEHGSAQGSAQYIAVAEIDHLPTVEESNSGGVLVDFSMLQILQAKKLNIVPINHLWLRTDDSPAALAHVRSVLSTSLLRLEDLSDRRMLLAALDTDPLALNLLVILGVGATAALLLALIANILTPLLNIRERLTSFVILRALGAAPGQVVRILAWEQGLVFALALLLGGAFGALLTLSVVPNLVFTGIAPSSAAASSGDQIFTIQQLLPTQIVLPLSLGIVLFALVILCALALGLLGRLVLRPVMGEALRISED